MSNGTTMNVNEICAAILKMDNPEDIRNLSQRLNATIKARYAELQRHKVCTLGVGMQVEFTDKIGNTFAGKITKINTKTVEVFVAKTSTRWKVTPSLLRIAA